MNKYGCQIMNSWDIVQSTFCTVQWWMCIKFEVSIPNILGLVEINVAKKNKYVSKIINICDLSNPSFPYAQYRDAHR